MAEINPMRVILIQCLSSEADYYSEATLTKGIRLTGKRSRPRAPTSLSPHIYASYVTCMRIDNLKVRIL
jgi:hypothetical protein